MSDVSAGELLDVADQTIPWWTRGQDAREA
jgi:hypothetical protein